MDEELKCPVCRRVFTKPVLLPCSHSMCVACALSLQGPASRHLPQTTMDDRAPLPGDQIFIPEMPDLDKLSIVSETDSGVVCDSRPSSYVGTPSVASIFIQSLQSCSWAIRCIVCDRLVFLEDSGALSLPTNRALECIVDKYHRAKKMEPRCDKCSEAFVLSSKLTSEFDEKPEWDRMESISDVRRDNISGQCAVPEATIMCVQCDVFYCEACLAKCHSNTESKHNLVDLTHGHSLRKRQSAWEQKCPEHRHESMTKYCLSCRLPVCENCAQDGRHMNHEVRDLGMIANSQKTIDYVQNELSKALQSLSEKAKSGTEFIQRLKKMEDGVNVSCSAFEERVISQCDGLIKAIRQRKEELLDSLHQEREEKMCTLKDQVSDCTSYLHRATGFLQFCIEVLKETDPASFLQVSQDLVNRALSADSSFTKQMNMIPKVSANFELMLDTTSCERSIESLNFFQVKAPCRLFIIPDDCFCQNNSVTVAWKPHIRGVSDTYTLELDDGNGGEFRVVYVGRELICTVDGLHFNSIYTARVKAHNYAGVSEYSDVISLQTAEVAWFSFDPATSHDDLIFSNNNQSVTCPGFDHRVAMGSVGFSKGVHYWELVIDSYDCHTDPSIGVCRYDVDKGVILGKDEKAWSMYVDNKRSWFLNRDEHTNRTDGGVRRGDVIGVLLDLNHHTLSYLINHTPHGPIAFNTLHGIFFPAVSINRNVRLTLRTGLEPPVDSDTFDIEDD